LKPSFSARIAASGPLLMMGRQVTSAAAAEEKHHTDTGEILRATIGNAFAEMTGNIASLV
jgi:hypothetical protein